MAHFQKALEYEPNSAKAHKNLADTLLQIGRVDEAMVHFQKALEIQPGLAEAYNGLGIALLQRGQANEAFICFQKTLESQPDYAEAHYNLGNILLQNGRVDEAVIHLQKVLEIQPGDAPAHNYLADALLQQGRVDEAISHLQTALKLQPDDAHALSSLAWVLATCPAASIRNGARAIELAQRASQLSGGRDPMILRTLAAAYAEGGRLAEAVTTARQALSFAIAQNNTALGDALHGQIELYQAGSPYRDPRLAAAPAR